MRHRLVAEAVEAMTRRALAIFAIEGAQLVARSHEEVSVYDDIVETYGTSLLASRLLIL